MCKVRIKMKNRGWEMITSKSGNNTYLKGALYKNGNSLDRNYISNQLNGIQTDKKFEDLISSLNGFFAIVHQQKNKVYIAVDRIRSIPLFYGSKNGHFFISDHAEWVRQQINDREIEDVAKEEFQLTGYVTGRNTLFPNVKQLQAGEIIVLNNYDLKVGRKRYYQFQHHELESYNKKDLIKELNSVVEDSIKRLIDYASGRQIVVPLSGGYDSRLIVTMLNHFGYENILTFSYGKLNCKEAKYSKKIAKSLGLKWEFVKYDEDLWKRVWQSEERWDYQTWASNWTSLAHMQDWLAIKILKENNVIDPEAILVPGHSGDFAAGSHIPSMTFAKNNFTVDDLSDAILKKHYNLVPIGHMTKDANYWKEYILRLIKNKEVRNASGFVNAFEKWDWQERQAKYICNSVRVYEYYGYDWWMPLWDFEFIKFWQKVPLRLRKRRNLYIQYVNNIYNKNVANDNFQEFGNASENLITKILKLPIFETKFGVWIKNIDWLKKALKYWNKINQNSSLARRGRYSRKKLNRLKKKGHDDLKGINALDFITKVKKKTF